MLGSQILSNTNRASLCSSIIAPTPNIPFCEALHATGLTALVGREENPGRVVRRWSGAKTSKGHMVLLLCEAWMGKSLHWFGFTEGRPCT
jgi:hypothetical protein